MSALPSAGRQLARVTGQQMRALMCTAAPGCPTHTPRPGAMRPRSRKGHRAPLASLALLGTEGGSSPEARAPSRRPLKPRRPAGRRETTLVTGALGGRGPLWAKSRRRGLLCARADPQGRSRTTATAGVHAGSSALPGRPPSLPFLPLWIQLPQQTVSLPQLCPPQPPTQTLGLRAASSGPRPSQNGRQMPRLRAPPCSRHILCETSHFSAC